MKVDMRGLNFKVGNFIVLASSVLISQLKRSWQNWYSCVTESLGKTLIIKIIKVINYYFLTFYLTFYTYYNFLVL